MSVHAIIDSPQTSAKVAVVKIECEELNDKVLLCFAEKKDWRQCQTEVKEFKECFEKFKKENPVAV